MLENPIFGFGKKERDYGIGFYTSEEAFHGLQYY